VLNDFKYAATDVFHLYTFPAHMGSRGVITMGVVTAATGVTLLLDDELDRWVVAHPSAVPMDAIKPFRVDQSPNLEALGNGTYMLGFSGGLYLLGVIFGSDDLRDAGIGCAAAEKSQSMMRAAIFKLVARSRPMTAEGDQYLFDVPGGDWYVRSFYGGHGANIMTCVSFFNHRFDLSIAEPVMMGLAAGVGLGRVADRAHWLSDTVVGAAVGFFMGRAVARRQLERKAEREGKTQSEDQRDAGGFFATHDGVRLLVGWRYTF
jgi:membrane-associated phospholipid phosphatase